MTESALPARLKLNLKRQRPRGGVWAGDRCGELRRGHADDGKRAPGAIEVVQGASPFPFGKGSGGNLLSRDQGSQTDLIGFSLISTPSHLDMIDLYLCFDV